MDIHHYKRVETLSERLINILDTINEGVVIFDEAGNVTYGNVSLCKSFEDMGVKDSRGFIKDIWNETNRNLPKDKIESINAKEVIINHRGEQYRLLLSFRTLQQENGNKEIIICFQDLKKIQQKANPYAQKGHLKFSFDDIIGIDPSFLEAKEIGKKASLADANVLIYGESGTGKELFARAIHNMSRRKNELFIPINCGAIPEGLLESEVFGYEKGSFTGAMTNRMGKFEVADNGTIFLDEISEMQFHLQVKLLRVLQDREVYRIGSNHPVKINIKVIAASNKKLTEQISKGLFREDLYYRLNVIPIHIPPLRKRKGDIIYLADYFIQYYCNHLNMPIKRLSKSAQTVFLNYHWPGNVRELQHVIEYAVHFEKSDMIDAELIEKRIKMSNDQKIYDGLFKNTMEDSLKEAVRNFEARILKEKISYYKDKDDSNMVRNICGDLKISKATFYRKLNECSIHINENPIRV